MLSYYQMQLLAMKIRDKLREDFIELHLTGNLMETIQINKTGTGFEIEIPAEIYDLKTWYEKGVIVYTGNGSYAQDVDVEGGFSGKHKNYVEDAIKEAISEWVKELNFNVRKVDII